LDDGRTEPIDLDAMSMSIDPEAARITQMPDSVTEEEANRVYVNYNFRVEYDENLAIYKSRQEASIIECVHVLTF